MFGRIGKAWKLAGILNKVPIVNYAPMLVKMLDTLPKAIESMSEEERTALGKNLLLAASKAAGKYANS